MKHAIAILALLLSGCVGKNGAPVNWPKGIVDCVADDAVTAIVDAVSDILFSRPDSIEIDDAAKQELEQLARDKGPSVVACAVEFVKSEIMRPGASTNQASRAAAMRGADFLSDVGSRPKFTHDTGQE